MIKETKININTNKVNGKIRIMAFSDIHYSSIKDLKKLEYLYNRIKKYELDYICIPGDILDSSDVDSDYLVKWLIKLSSICTVLLSFGNHDIRIKNKKENIFHDNNFFEKLCDIENVYILNNTYKTFNNLYFYGFSQSFNYYYEYKNENKELMKKEMKDNNVSDLNPNKFNILLMHSPICIDDEDIKRMLDNYDLILCGHMHNGVVPPILDEIFDNNVGLFAPNKNLFPKNARGVINRKNTIVISGGVTKISRSTGKYLKFLNIFFPISINYIEITNEKIDKKKDIKYYI